MPAIAAGSFDGMVADPGAQRIYLADRAARGIDVVDDSSSTPRFVGTVVLSSFPNGVAFAADQHRLYAGLEDGSVAVVDTTSLKIVDTVAVGTNAVDLLDYSSLTRHVYAATGDAGEVITIDATTEKIDQLIAVGGPVEQPRLDPADGMLYVSKPRSDAIVQLDPTTGKETRAYVIPKCHPAGVAINPSRQLAMLACGSSVGWLNLRTGASSVTHEVQGGDIVSYDSTADRFVLASPHGRSDSAVSLFAGSGDFLGSVTASPKAHAAVMDDAHGLVYAPGNSGLVSFAPAACPPTPDWLSFAGGFSMFAVPFAALVLVLVVYARRMGRPRGVKGPTMLDLHKEDRAAEHERMRALEDSIFGPEP